MSPSVHRWVRRLLPAAAYQFFFIVAVSMLKPAANALTLARFQTSALPWLYLGSALLTALLTAASLGRRRAGPGRLAFVGAATVAILTIGLTAGVPGLPLVTYLFAETFATQVALTFWATVGEAFDAREARRAYTWMNGIGMSGAIAGGYFAHSAARQAGTLWLLGGAAVALSLAGFAFTAHRSLLVSEPVKRKPRRLRWPEALAQPYVRLLGVVVLCFSLISVLTDFAFRQQASALDEAGMASFFGTNQLWAGVFCVVFQLLLAEQLLRRFGILRFFALVPVVLAILGVATIIWPSTGMAWGLKLAESAASWSLLPVVYQLLYAPLPDDSRDGLRRFIDGFWRKGGLAFAGMGLVLLREPLGPTGILVSLVGVCVLAVVLLFRLHHHYVAAVKVRVASHDSTLPLDQVTEWEHALLSPAPERVLRAADVLEHVGALREQHVVQLLAHPHERVQERGVLGVLALSLTSQLEAIETLLAFGSRRPRDASAWALATLWPERALDVLPPLLEADDVGLRCAAIGGLLSMTTTTPHVLAFQKLDALLERGPSAPTSERREVARLLGRLGSKRTPQLETAISTSLQDADSTVRRLAIIAVGHGGYVELAPKLMRFLSWRDDRQPARESLARLGDRVVPLIAGALDDRSRALALRVQLPRVLRDIGSQAAFDALLSSSTGPEPLLQHRIGLALMQLRERAGWMQVDEARLREALERHKLRRAALVPVATEVSAALGPNAILARALGDRLAQSYELSFWHLALIHEPRVMRRCHAHLTGDDSRRRAWAVELLENLIGREWLETVADGLTGVFASPSSPRPLSRHIEDLCRSDDGVLRACARALARAQNRWPRAHQEDDMSEGIVQRLMALEGVEIFRESDVDDLAAVAAIAREETFHPGDHIYAEGDPGDALYVIVSGAAEARRDGEVVLRLAAKEAFGETSLFDGAPRVNDVVVIQKTTALIIDRRDFLDLLADRPELLAGMFRMVARQLKSMVVEVTSQRRVSGRELTPVRPGPPIADEAQD